MDGWMMSSTVPWQAWLRGQGLMDTDSDPDGADEGQNVTSSRRRSKGVRRRISRCGFSHYRSMGSSAVRGASAWLLTWALPTVAVTLRMQWGRRDALQYVHALCRVHADTALRACVALDVPTWQAVPWMVSGAMTKNGERGPAAACEWPHLHVKRPTCLTRGHAPVSAAGCLAAFFPIRPIRGARKDRRRCGLYHLIRKNDRKPV